MIKHIQIAAFMTLALIAFAAFTPIEVRAQGAEQGSWRLDIGGDAFDARAQSDRLSGIKQTLRLSTEQDKLWGPVEEALINIRENRRAFRTALSESEPTDQIERLRRRAAFAAQQADALKKLADAIQPLWATLSDEQKRDLTRGLRMGPRIDQDRRMGSRRFDDDGGIPRRPDRGGWRDDDQDRTDRDRRDRDSEDWRQHRHDRMMGRRGGDDSDDRDDMRRDRFDRSSRFRSQDDDYRPRSRDFDRDRRDDDRRSFREYCRCYRVD